MLYNAEDEHRNGMFRRKIYNERERKTEKETETERGTERNRE